MTKKKHRINTNPYMPLDLLFLGASIRKLREDHGISQQYLAELAELTPSFVSHLELGNRSPSLESLHRLAHELGTTVDGLVSGVPPEAIRIAQLLCNCSETERKMTGDFVEALFFILKKYTPAA